MRYVLGIDVGSGSARCGVFDGESTLIGVGKHPIAQHRPETDHVEQSSENIWSAICTAVAEALAAAQVDGADVTALSYSATCSLVLLDKEHNPLPLSTTDTPWNIIMWMDHRATAETDEVNATGSSVLRNLGGAISVEMEIPKLMWVKRNRPEIWDQLGYAGDLADFLCFKSTGTFERSACTLGCKWTFDPDAGGWNTDFLRAAGLDDLLERAALPPNATPIGAGVGSLTEAAARDLGLTTSCSVGMGLIDAHAGALGTSGLHETGIDQRLALIAGTSNCHIALTKRRTEVAGVWGPYAGAVLEGWYALEGGQSATGAALDQILGMFRAPIDKPHQTLGQAFLDGLQADPEYGSEICVLPDFLGNRSPFADPSMRGAILGLSLENLETMLPKLYGATALGIAFGTRQIIDAMRSAGLPIKAIDLSGGHVKSDLLVQLYADATGCDLFLPACEEPVLLGAACAAAKATAENSTFHRTAANAPARLIKPNPRRSTNLQTRYERFSKHYPKLERQPVTIAKAL
ncbi:FGGY family pentulose kinase [Yoonia sp. GPGPB17]|uniref:FGGY family pentulose kinase n=1 Tax=Yoonia sp. GPGPB17 TaxID=3026147 RepID=UPI0030C3601B